MDLYKKNNRVREINYNYSSTEEIPREDEFKIIVDEVIPISEIRARFSEGLCINIDKINAMY